MSDQLGNFDRDPDDVLVQKMRGAIGRDYDILWNEMQRRVALRQISAAKAQFWSAIFQFAAVLIAAAALIVSLLKSLW